MVNNGHAHWLTISTIGAVNGTVNVYDSLHECQLICAMAMSEDRLVKKVYMDEARGRRPRRWPGKRWQDTILN